MTILWNSHMSTCLVVLSMVWCVKTVSWQQTADWSEYRGLHCFMRTVSSALCPSLHPSNIYLYLSRCLLPPCCLHNSRNNFSPPMLSVFLHHLSHWTHTHKETHLHYTGSLQHYVFSIQLCDCFFCHHWPSPSFTCAVWDQSHSAPGSAAGYLG